MHGNETIEPRIIRNKMTDFVFAPLIFNVAAGASEGSFFSRHLAAESRWRHIDAGAAVFSSRVPFAMRRVAAAIRAARSSRKDLPACVVTHDPRVSYSTAISLRSLGYRGRILAFSFNYSSLPAGMKLRMHRWGFRLVDDFVVYSRMERELYHKHLQIPLERLHFIYWGVNAPAPEPADRPLEGGEYICALGGNSRDYGCLLKSMHVLPHIRLVLVARPRNLVGLKIPENVTVRQDIPLGQAMNILKFSRFMVLPLKHSQVPCGHVTLVSAMHLAKAFVITGSEGVADYAMDGQNAVLVPAGDSGAMAEAISNLWNDADRRDALGRHGRDFALEHCTENHTLSWFRNYISNSVGISLSAQPSGIAIAGRTGHE